MMDFYRSLLCGLIAAGGGAAATAQPTGGLLQIVQQQQAEYLDRELGLFMHFNMSTYTDDQIAGSNLNPDTFSPTAFDPTQWAQAAKAAGMQYAVLTTKHFDGFALWDTSRSSYDITATRWHADEVAAGRDGDIVRRYVDAFRAEGIAVGFYYSGTDTSNGVTQAADPAFATQYIKDEITELLTNYGEIESIWIDSWEWIGYEQDPGLAQQTPGYGVVPMQEIYDHIKAVSPGTLLANNAHQTKPDENNGQAFTDPLGNYVIAGRLTDPRDGKYVSDIDVREDTPALDPFLAPGNTVPSEVANRIAPGWFWNSPDNSSLEMTLANRLDEIGLTNGRGGNYLLNASPDRTGQLPGPYVTRLADLGMARRGGNLALGRPTTQNATFEGFGQVHAAGYAVDGVFSSESGVRIGPGEVWLASSTPGDGSNPWWEVDLEAEAWIEEVVLWNRDLLQSRLSDIVVQVLDESREVLYASELLNPGNEQGDPAYLRIVLDQPALGRYVRVEKTDSGQQAGSVLSLAEVQVFGVVPEPSSLVVLGLMGSWFGRRRCRN